MILKKALFAATVVMATFGISNTANAGGFWGHCAAWDNGKTYYFENGNSSQQVCFEKARKYFANSSTWKATYYSSPVLISGKTVIIVRN